MENLTRNFVENPNEETFSLIEISSFALNDVFKRYPSLADQFFQFKHWFLLYRDKNNSLDVKKKLGESVKTFDDAVKYYFALNYEGRQEYAPKLIEKASTVRELTTTFHYLGNAYRQPIVTKMHEIATTDEDKEFVKHYHI